MFGSFKQKKTRRTHPHLKIKREEVNLLSTRPKEEIQSMCKTSNNKGKNSKNLKAKCPKLFLIA